ncbi:hypothetical protein ACO0QE_001790 [Hanseniaspora vineae]
MLRTAGKHALRKELRKNLKKLSQDELNKQSHHVLFSLANLLDQLVAPSTKMKTKKKPAIIAQDTPIGVACYMNMDDSEIKTLNIIKYLFNKHTNDGDGDDDDDNGQNGSSRYKVYLPRCTSTRETNQVNFRSLQDLKHQDHLTFHHMDSFESVVDLKPVGKYKLREPQVDLAETSLNSNSDDRKTIITYKKSSDPTSVRISDILENTETDNTKINEGNLHTHVTHEKVNDNITLYHPPPKDIQIIIVPGLGFNVEQMSRIGHGKGYYDDYIKRHIHYHKSSDGGSSEIEERPVLIGVCLKEQILKEKLPLEDHDYLMDYIIDGSGEVYVNEATSEHIRTKRH